MCRQRNTAPGIIVLAQLGLKNAPFAPKMAAQVRRALLQIAPKAKWTDRLLRAASILKSFTVTFSTDAAMTAVHRLIASHRKRLRTVETTLSPMLH